MQYLRDPGVAKEELARELARRDKIKEGLICIFSAVEPLSFLFGSWRSPEQARQAGFGDAQVHAFLPLLPALTIWVVACAAAELVCLHGRYLSQWMRVAGPTA